MFGVCPRAIHFFVKIVKYKLLNQTLNILICDTAVFFSSNPKKKNARLQVTR